MSLPDIRVTRYQLDGTRCGMVQGRCAAWNWAYRIHCDGTCPNGGCERSHSHDVGRGLANARDIARRIALRVHATRVREDWPRGKVFTLGARGGLRRAG